VAQLVALVFVALLTAREVFWSVGGSFDLPKVIEIGLLLPGCAALISLAPRKASSLSRLAPWPALSYVIFVRGPELGLPLSSAELASRRAAVLSTLVSGLPLVNLVALLGLLLSTAAWGQRQAECGEGSPLLRKASVSCVVVHFALGLASLLSYGAGSPVPFVE
jgi:hypothetical protein